jgi:glycosyltransferase involved in cell wall biosynthesis
MRPVWALFVRGFVAADYLQAISTFLLSWGERMGFKGKSFVIPNGVDGARFSHLYSDEEIVAKKKELGKKDGELFLITTSRLVAKNAVDDVVRAMPKIPSEVIFLICGIGPDEEMLRSLVKELGIENRVRFMGQVSHAEMPLLLQASDIFIRPSRSEGMGNSFIEAMAARLPVVATQEGGISDFLFDEVRNPLKPTTGWAVDANEPDQIADAVTRIIMHPEKVREVVATASAMVKNEYDWNSVAVRMRALFAEALSVTPAVNTTDTSNPIQ